MFKCALQASTELTVERLRSSAAAAHNILYINNALSRRDGPHNIGITTLLLTIDVCGSRHKASRVPHLRSLWKWLKVSTTLVSTSCSMSTRTQCFLKKKSLFHLIDKSGLPETGSLLDICTLTNLVPRVLSY